MTTVVLYVAQMNSVLIMRWTASAPTSPGHLRIWAMLPLADHRSGIAGSRRAAGLGRHWAVPRHTPRPLGPRPY